MGLFNEQTFNAASTPRIVSVRAATALSVERRIQRDAQTVASVGKHTQRFGGTSAIIRRIRSRDHLTIIGVSRIRSRDAASGFLVVHGPVIQAATQIRIDRTVRKDCGAVVGIRRPIARDVSTAVSVAARGVRDGKTVLSVGTQSVIDAETKTQIARVRSRSFTTGVSVPGMLDRSARTAVSVGRWRFLEAPTVIYPKRTRVNDAATQVQVERVRSRGFATDLFVGRRRIRFSDSVIAIGTHRTTHAVLYARIDRVRRHDAGTGVQVDRSWFDTHPLGLLPSIWREQDTTGDLAAFLRTPAATLDEFKNRLDAFPSMFDVDECDPAFLPFLAAMLGWPLDAGANTDLQRRALREAVEFYRRKGTIPAITRSLENIGWRGRLFETFRGMLRTNRRARLNELRLAGTVFNQGVYRVESDNIVPGVREALAPHHPAGARVFFLQNMDLTEDAGRDADAGFRRASRTGSFVSQHENFILNQRHTNAPFPLTRKITAFETARITRGLYAEQELTESHGIVERWQRPVGGLSLNRTRLNWTGLTNVGRTALRLSFELDVDVARDSGKAVPLTLGRRRLNQAGLQQGSRYRWRFRQVEDGQEIAAGLESAANEYVIRQWPAA